MTSIEWYRVYHGMPEDAKLKVVAKRCGHLMTHVVTVWLCVLDAASRHKTRGTVQVDSEQIAVVQDIPQKTVEDMRAWKHYCEIIGASEFCLGKIAGKGWTIDLSWAVESSDHVAKILEGGFSGGNHPPKAPACDVPALQEAWDRVLEAFQKKHGKASGRSWLSSTRIIRILKYGDGAVVTMRCPSKFIQEWLTTHYLADLTRWFAEATKHDTPVKS